MRANELSCKDLMIGDYVRHKKYKGVKLVSMFLDFLEMSLYPLLLFVVPFIAVAILLGVSDYMDGKEDKLKKQNNK